jgi:hypothetical protein
MLVGQGKSGAQDSLSEKISEAAISVDWKNSSGCMYPGRKMHMTLSRANSRYHRFQLISDKEMLIGYVQQMTKEAQGRPYSWPKYCSLRA